VRYHKARAAWLIVCLAAALGLLGAGVAEILAGHWPAGLVLGLFAWGMLCASFMPGMIARLNADEDQAAELEPLPRPHRYRAADPVSRWHHPEDFR